MIDLASGALSNEAWAVWLCLMGFWTVIQGMINLMGREEE
jgi:hypothetical protein